MLGLLDRDREFAETLRRDGVLEDVRGHELDLRAGVILVTCADGDQMCDLFLHHAGLHRAQRETPRPHLLSLNGGALRIPRGLSFNESSSEVLFGDIRDARRIKSIDTVALYVHAPCGVARLAGFSLERVVELLMAAKLCVKEECGAGVRVACFIHTDWGDERKRTYFISRANWMAWLEKRPSASMSPEVTAAPA